MLEIELTVAKDFMEKDRFSTMMIRFHYEDMITQWVPRLPLTRTTLFFSLIALTYRVLSLKSTKSLVVHLIFFNELNDFWGFKLTRTCVRICFRSISCFGYYN